MASEPSRPIVRTVLGDVPVEDIGITAMHEHLFIDFRVRHDPTGAVLADDEGIFSPEHRAHLHTHPAAYVTNLVRDSVDEAFAELKAFATAGGDTVVDLTTRGLGHDRARLAAAARKGGVHVVAGAGHYVHAAHAPDVHDAPVEELAEEIISDLTVGNEAGIRCGIIGEIGVDAFEDCELKVFDAAIEAHRATGAAVAVHVRSGVDPSCRVPTVALVDRFVDGGGDPGQLMLCHQDGSGDDPAYQSQLLQRGAVIAFDTFGFQIPFRRHGKLMALPTDEDRIDEVVALIAEGWSAQVVLSHDLCYRMMTTACGGWGLAHLLDVVAARLLRRGAGVADMEEMLVRNPRRLLTMPGYARR